MARKKDLCRAANGQFVRNLGWKRTATGYVQPKFYLGADESAARLASVRLEQLWEQITKRWQRQQAEISANDASSTNPGKTTFGSQWAAISGPSELGHRTVITRGVPGAIVLFNLTDRPIWDDVSIAIADAVRLGLPVATVPIPVECADFRPESGLLAEWLNQLQADITVIKVEFQDPVTQGHSDEYVEREGQRLMAAGRRMMHRKSGGETFYTALDAYSKWVEKKFVDVEKRLTPWGANQKRQINFMRKHLPNCMLGDLNVDRIDEWIDILRLRPLRSDGDHVSVAWAHNCIKQFRNFVRWLNKTSEFDWKRPADLEFGQVRIPLLQKEKAASAHSAQVQTFERGELEVCWQFASPFQRVLMLLALNCGFGRSEVASLELKDLFLRKAHPNQNVIGITSTDADSWILFSRPKTGVYGEWKLWPETVDALDWWLKQRELMEIPDSVASLLVNKNGSRYDSPTKGNNPNQQIPNSWSNLINQIRREEEYKNFRQLSFNKLRKTGGNLIRSLADGETAGVFLCHGRAVKSDDLIDFYTNRPFEKVFKAIDAAGEKLRPIWKSVTEPFPQKRKAGGPNISKRKIQRIQELRRQGFTVDAIAEELKLGRTTVWRWATQSSDS